MVRLNKFLPALLISLIFSCENDFFPEGLYGYQVERMLTNDSLKSWFQNEVESCELSNGLLFYVAGDSMVVEELQVNCTLGLYDTLSLGKAKTTSRLDLLFSDSIVFSNGNFWLVERVTPEEFQFLDGTDLKIYSY